MGLFKRFKKIEQPQPVQPYPPTQQYPQQYQQQPQQYIYPTIHPLPKSNLFVEALENWEKSVERYLIELRAIINSLKS